MIISADPFSTFTFFLIMDVTQ